MQSNTWRGPALHLHLEDLPKYTLVLVLVVALVLRWTGNGSIDHLMLTPVEQQLFEAQNRERTSRGLAPLELDQRLVRVARLRAQENATAGRLSHADARGDEAYVRLLKQAGYAYGTSAENLARNAFDEDDTGAEAVAGFLDSPTHREALLDPRFRRVGVGAWLGADLMTYIAVIYSDR